MLWLLVWPSVMAYWFGLLFWPSDVAFWCGLLEWPSVMAFWCDFLSGLLLWPSGLAFCYTPSGHTPWTHLQDTSLDTHPQDIMVNKQVVCILLECFLVENRSL